VLDYFRICAAAFNRDRAEVVRRRLSEVQHAVEAREREQRAALALGDGRKAVAAADDAYRRPRATDRCSEFL